MYQNKEEMIAERPRKETMATHTKFRNAHTIKNWRKLTHWKSLVNSASFFFFEMRISLCGPGSSWTPGLKPSSYLSLLNSWEDDRSTPPHLTHLISLMNATSLKSIFKAKFRLLILYEDFPMPSLHTVLFCLSNDITFIVTHTLVPII
jgi:hypothetical protein